MGHYSVVLTQQTVYILPGAENVHSLYKYTLAIELSVVSTESGSKSRVVASSPIAISTQAKIVSMVPKAATLMSMIVATQSSVIMPTLAMSVTNLPVIMPSLNMSVSPWSMAVPA